MFSIARWRNAFMGRSFASFIGVLFVFCLLAASSQSQQNKVSRPEPLPTGMSITPTAARGSTFQALNPDLPELPQFTADHPVSTASSPDGSTLLILTSGYNRNNDSKGKAIPALSSEYVFVF